MTTEVVEVVEEDLDCILDEKVSPDNNLYCQETIDLLFSSLTEYVEDNNLSLCEFISESSLEQFISDVLE